MNSLSFILFMSMEHRLKLKIYNSICRNRMGKGATGPITWLAHAKGFASVKDYLGSLMVKNGSDEFDDEDDKCRGRIRTFFLDM